jgi:macrolide transport system ATP-binding/permease protein
LVIWRDLRYAIRTLIRSPGFFAVAFIAIALGIGVNTTILGIVNALLLRPLPIGHSDAVVQVFTTDTHFVGRSANSYLNFLDYQKQNSVFSEMAAYSFAGVGMTRGGETFNVLGQLVSGNYFGLLELRPFLGRGFLPEEDTAPNGHPVAVLSYKFWKKLGGDGSIIGNTIILNGRAFTVIGVAPPGFTGVDIGVAPEVWVPLAMHGWIRPSGDEWFENRRALFLSLLARVKPGVSILAAQAQMQTVAHQLERAYPDVNKERSIVLVPAEKAKAQGIGGPGNENATQDISLLLSVAAGSILLIACANVANLLLARATTRQREMAIRLALGAGRGRVVRQLLTESLLLASIGGIGGIVLAYWLGDVLVSLLPATPVPLSLDPQPDFRVVISAVLLALLSGVIFGLAPALQTARWDLTQGLRERAIAPGGGGIHRWNLRNLLVIAQIAVSLLLLIGSALFLKSFHSAQQIDPGFRTENLVIVSIDPALAGYDQKRGGQIARDIVEQVRRDPQVRSADLGQFVPLGFGGEGRTIVAEGRDENAESNRKIANISAVTPGYFETMRVPILRGRNFTEHDASENSAKVAIISETMAKTFWPDEDAIGRRFRYYNREGSFEVIGLARDVKTITLGETPVPMLYTPFRDLPDGGITIFVHTVGTPGPMLAEAHRIVRNIDNHISITYEKTVAQHLAFALWPSWMGAVLLGSLGLLALLLASVGVYGVMAYSVSQRTRELGIRMALGAQSNQVLQLVLRQGMLLAAIGLILGLLAAFGSTRMASTLLYGVNPSDPTVFLGVTLLLALAAFAACYFPARRALKIDPVIALRFE